MGFRTIIFDIDGTLADVAHRRHHVASKPKNWPAFFAAMDKDPPVKNVVEFCQQVLRRMVCKVVYCSGRGEEYRTVTEAWLREHVYKGLFSNWDTAAIDLRMRPAKDSRDDRIIKREMLDALRAEGHDIWFAVDDRQRVVDMWRENGVTVFQCAPGDFDTSPSALYTPKGGELLLRLMVGPSGAGKSMFIEEWKNGLNDVWGTKLPALPSDAVISSDQVRAQMCADFRDQSQNARVFSYVHAAAKARLDHGLKTVIDATHLHRKDRLAAVALAPKGTVVEYVVMDRPLADKLRDGGWRLSAVRDGKNLVEMHHQTFQSVKKDVLNGDGLPNVVVTDHREVWCR